MLDKSNIIPVGCDHGGYELKEFLKNKLIEEGYIIHDFGTNSTDSMDYPDVAHPLAKEIDENIFVRGILICGSGNGVCMTANKYLHVRAALCWNTELAKLARLHNDANILCLPGRFIDKNEAWNAVLAFMQTEFEGGRHITRIEKMRNFEKDVD